MGTLTKFRVWSDGKEYEHYSTTYDSPIHLARGRELGDGWIHAMHFGVKTLIRWSTVTRVELYDQDIAF